MVTHLDSVNEKSEFRFLVILGTLVLGILSIYVIFMSRLFRPIADDYLVSAHSQNGPFQATWYWYQTWSGDLISGFNNSLLVGIPVLNFDWSISTAFPYWVTVTLLAFTILLTLSRVTVSLNFSKRWLIAVSALGIMLTNVMWISFWWTSPSLGSPNPEIAVAATMWQNVTVNYVFDQYLFIFLMLTSGFWKLHQLTFKNAAYAILIGIVAGLSGIVSGLTFLTLCIIGMIRFRFFGKFNRGSKIDLIKVKSGNAPFNFLLVVAAFCALALYVALNAPGLANRASVETDFSIPNKTLTVLINYVIAPALSSWYDGISSAGSFVVLFASIGVGAAATRRTSNSHLELRELHTIGAIFLSASILESVFSRLSEAYSYPAYWHLVGPRSLMFTGILVTGLAIGFHFDSTLNYGIRILTFPVLIATSLLMLGSAFYFSSVIEERHQKWNLGPAPVFAVPDIDEAWRYGCYLEISVIKSSPPRSLDADPETKYECLYFDRVVKEEINLK